MENREEIAIIFGSVSDYKKFKKDLELCEELGLDANVEILSAHRNPDELDEFVKEQSCYVGSFITVAGLAAALPGVVASKTIRPVIGVPVSNKLGGIDALLSIVQMPTGVPVATVGIDNLKNAILLAARIATVSTDIHACMAMSEKLTAYNERIAAQKETDRKFAKLKTTKL